MKLVPIPLKGSPALKEAIRVLAFKQGHNNRSKTAIDILEQHPDIKKQLKKSNGSSKK